MSENYPLLPIGRRAGGAIAAHRILRPGTSDGVMLQASAADQMLIAVSGPQATASGQRVEAHFAGIVPVEYGAVVEYGQELTADSQGRAVPATDGNRVAGIAMEAGGVGTIGSALIAPQLKPEPPGGD
jgi:hypothetical protein